MSRDTLRSRELELEHLYAADTTTNHYSPVFGFDTAYSRRSRGGAEHPGVPNLDGTLDAGVERSRPDVRR